MPVGIANIKPIIALSIEMGNVIDKVIKADTAAGKLQAVLAITDEVMALPSVNFAEVIGEVKDLDEAEKAELLAFFKEKFDIADDKIEAVIESGLALLVKASGLVQEAIDLAKSVKA